MKTKMLLATLALTFAPTLALAMGCSHGYEDKVVMSCADGTVFDAATERCVDKTTS